MGKYLNPTNDKFRRAVNSAIYVDKTGLISYTNKVLFTKNQNVCVSRPRRFGKTMAANMLTAYYSKGCNSKELFEPYEISRSTDFEKNLNKYHVISVNMQDFLSSAGSVEAMICNLTDEITEEILDEIHMIKPEYVMPVRNILDKLLYSLYQLSKTGIIFIIDEWDCVMREYKNDKDVQEKYLDFLRYLLKDKEYIHLAYMTGILPIKKYGTHSALNMFEEYSMLYPGPLAEYVGFTEKEVISLCEEKNIDFDNMKKWYDGYILDGVDAVYSPKSVENCVRQNGKFQCYWNHTESFEALQVYIDMNFAGLNDEIIRLMSGEHISVHTSSFLNDMSSFSSKDDVLTLLIHLGYLAYDSETRQAYIPNHEVMEVYENSIRNSDWGNVTTALQTSIDTLKSILNKDQEKTAKYIENAHFETSHLQYNDENALSYTISLALYAARNDYTVVREFPTGKGFADLVYLPRKNVVGKPALLVELKWDQSAEGAIAQIKEKRYVDSLRDYYGDLLLIGVNYDKKTKEHSCIIEEIKMN